MATQQTLDSLHICSRTGCTAPLASRTAGYCTRCQHLSLWSPDDDE